MGGWLSARGHKVSYLVGQTSIKQWQGGKVYSLSKNLRVRFNGNRLSTPIWSRRAEIEDVLARGKPDIVHVMAPYSPFLAQRIIRLSQHKSALVGSFHILPVGRLAATGARLLSWLQWLSLKKFDAFSATSPSAAEFAHKYMRIRSIVVPNAVDVAKFVSDTKITKDRIVFLGRLVERKGCRQLIEAFRYISREVPSAELIVAGKGPLMDKLQAQARRLKLDEQVKFLGYVEEKDKPTLLASAQIACFPSLGGESFGIVLLEAMAAGSGVVVGGDNPGYASVLGGMSQTLVKADNPQMLAERIVKLMKDKEMYKNLHSEQQKLVKNYDINKVGAQLEAIYYNILKDKA